MRTLTKAIFLTCLLTCSASIWAQDPNATKAQELLKQAREAIGGEANLKAIQSLIVEGKFKNAMMGQLMQGDLKIEMMMPDKYLRTATMNMGMTLLQCVNGEQVWTDRKMPDMSAMGGGGMSGGEGGFGGGGGMGGAGGGMSGGGGGMGGGGMGGGGGRGSRGGGGGMGMPGGGGRPNAGAMGGGAGMEKMVRNDYNQIMLSWFLTAPNNFAVEYAYERDLDTKVGKADVVRVTGPDNFVMWLLLDQKTHRPAGYVYRTMPPRRPDITDAREAQEPALINVQVFFAAYKTVGTVQLPHQITKASNGQLMEELNINKIKLNEKIKDKKFEKKS
jgi:hypothetical protein